MPPSNDPPRFNPLDMIRRAGQLAKEQRASEALIRMEEDDAADGDSFDDSSFDSPNPDSESLNLESSDAPSKGTVLEQPFSVDSTVELPSDQVEPSDEQPNLSNVAPSSRRASTTQPTLVATPRYRPSRRPPMAVVRVYDDDQQGYEGVRIRQTPFVIGRQDGDLIVGHERQMSRRHARIDRVQENEVWRWYLGDLRSTNGTFLKTDQAALVNGTEVLIAGELVRYVETPDGKSTLVRVAPASEEEKITLVRGSHLIGTDTSACLPFLRDSSYLDPKHIKLEYGPSGWRVVDLGSTNHLWVAVTNRTELTAGTHFQIGEQRFEFCLP